jgi:hypothetical protein
MTTGFSILINGEWLKDGDGILVFRKNEVSNLILNVAFSPGSDIHIFVNDKGPSTDSISDYCRKKAAELRQKGA